MTTPSLNPPARPTAGTSRQGRTFGVLAKIVAAALGIQMIILPVLFYKSLSHGEHTPSSLLQPHSQSSSSSSSTTTDTSSRRIRQPYTRTADASSVNSTTPEKKADGTFNGYPIYLREASSSNKPIHSSVQCVGNNYQENAWIHRSCKFRHFCFDTATNDFVVYQSEQDAALMNTLKASKSKYVDASANHLGAMEVAIGGINTKWTWSKGVPRLKWFPKVIVGELDQDYYEFDENVVIVPYHSFFAQNPGHLVWDDFLPVYTLLRMFSLIENGHQPLLMRYVLQGEGMWATCDWNNEKKKVCATMYKKFLPLFGLHDRNFSTSRDYRLEMTNSNEPPKSKLICAAQGAAGLGMLTDHGFKLHGWHKKDYETMHNHGRGAMLYDFRNFMVQNVGLEPNVPLKKGAPYIITFATSTSQSTLRDLVFDDQIQALKKSSFKDRIMVQKISFPSKSLKKQVEIASETAIYVSACGGGAVTAMFLPQGAASILYYVETGGVQSNRHTGLPARLDWDLFNNMAHMRSHWMPSGTMNNKTDIDVFVKLVEQELDLMDDQIF